MKITISLVALLVVVPFCVITTSSAQALDIVVNSNGDTLLYDTLDGSISPPTERSNRPTRALPASEQRMIRVQAEGEKILLERQTKQTTNTEELDSTQMRVQFPAGRSEKQEELRAKRAALIEESKQLRLDMQNQSEELREQFRSQREELLAKRQAVREEYQAYLEKIREERSARLEEMVELRKNLETSEMNAVELQARNVRAKIRGAQFVLDPETNTVGLITPSGNAHELNHLPDQAITRMSERGFFETKEPEGELVLEATENTPEYRMRSAKEKRFLGIFKRSVPSEVVLDDATGEVSETELPAESRLQRVLNALSF